MRASRYVYFIQFGGWGEIRTHGGVTPTPVFKTGALNHSTTHPECLCSARSLSHKKNKKSSDFFLKIYYIVLNRFI